LDSALFDGQPFPESAYSEAYAQGKPFRIIIMNRVMADPLNYRRTGIKLDYEDIINKNGNIKAV